MCFNLLQPSGNYMYHRFKQQISTSCPLCALSSERIIEQSAVVSINSPKELVFVTVTECV